MEIRRKIATNVLKSFILHLPVPKSKMESNIEPKIDIVVITPVTERIVYNRGARASVAVGYGGSEAGGTRA